MRRSNKRRRMVSAMVAGAVVLAPMAVAPAQASASGLTFTGLWCNSLGTHAGHTRMLCEAPVTGGVAPYTYQWSGIVNAGFPGSGPLSGRGECNIYSNYRVRVIVHDSAGASNSMDSGSIYCDPIAW